MSRNSTKFSSYDAKANDRSSLMGHSVAENGSAPEFEFEKALSNGSASRNTNTRTTTARIFRFSRRSLNILTEKSGAASTNDALSALIWRSIAKARVAINPELKKEKSKITYAADIRFRVKPHLPRNYLGNASMPAVIQDLEFADLVNKYGLQEAAGTIREYEDELLDAENISSTLSLLSSRDYRLK